MPDPDPAEQPSLELPKLGWRRRPRRARPAQPESPPTPEPAPEPAPVAVETPAPEPEQDELVEERPARRPRLRRPSGWPAVVATGLLVGLAVVGLTWGSLRTCEQVQGTSSCGTAGYPMLGLVVALAVLVGSLLLRLAQVPDPVSTSLLGVGVAAVIVLVFLINHLDQPAMVVVIPLICAATYAGAHWLTTAVIEPGRD